MSPLKKAIDNDFGAIDDEDIGAVDDPSADDIGAVDEPDPAVNPLEVQSRIEDNIKQEQAAAAMAEEQKKAAQEADPENWTLEKTKEYFKAHPAQSVHQEAIKNKVLQRKKEALKAAEDVITGTPQEDQLKAAPPKNIFGKIRGQINKTLGDIGIIESPELRQAKAMNIYAIAKNHNLDPVEVEKNYEDYAFNPEYTGLNRDANPIDVINAAMTPAVVAGVITAPEVVLPALATFGLLDKILPTHELLKKTNLTREAREVIEIVDLIGKGGVGGVAGKISGKVLRKKFPALERYSNFWHGVMGKEPPVDVIDEVKPGAEKPAAEVKPKPEVEEFGKKVTAELEKANVNREISPVEQGAQEFVKTKPEEARQKYIDRSVEEFKSDNVISADIGKFAIPEMRAEKSIDYHEAGSSLAKAREAELLKNPETKDLPVGFMAGGSGAGKSHILRAEGKDIQKDYALIHDTNLNHYPSAKAKIDRALASGRPVDITYVYRDPFQAFQEGVIPRTKTQDRIVPISEHIKTHQGSLPVVAKLAKEYEADPRVSFSLIDNSFAKGEHKLIGSVDKVPEFDYTNIEGKLYESAKQAYESGNIAREHFETAIKGSPKSEARYLEDQKAAGTEGTGKNAVDEAAGPPAAGVEQPAGKRRKFIQTVKSSEKTPDEVKQNIESRYDPISNKETLERAQEFVRNDYNTAIEKVMGSDKPTADLNAAAIVLIDKAQTEGRFADAISLVERTAEKQTELGQAIQALSMYNRLTPEGILMYAQKQVRRARGGVKDKRKLDTFERVEKALSQKDKDKMAKELGIPHISEIVAAELAKMAKQIQEMPEGREKQIQTALMLKKISDQVPRDWRKKLAITQTIAQLLNPKTFVRNLLGNVGFMISEGVSDSLATSLDIAASLATGKRTVYLPNMKLTGEGLAQGAREGLQEATLGINLKEDTTKFTLPKNGVFDKGVMGFFEKALRISLGVPDRAFYQAAFNQSIRDQMLSETSRGAKVEEPTTEMIERAHLLGLYRTFQDDNVISRQFVNLKRWLNVNKDFGLGDVILKYPKTPANILARGLEYSPFGFIKSMYELAKPLMGQEFNQEAFSRTTARALTGTTSQVALGAVLANLGIISGQRAKDYDVAATRENVGLRAYQMNISALKRFVMSGFDPEAAKIREDDTLISYDWIQPAAIGLGLGANMVIDPKTNLVDRTLNLAEQMATASETLQEQPLVQGVKRFAQTRNVGEAFTNAMQDIPASFVPTLLNQIRQLTDNTARNTKDPNYFKEIYNKAVMRVPFAASTLPAKITPLGDEKQMYQFGTNNPFNVFLNPAFVSKYKPDPVSKMVLDIWEMSGETVQFPRVASAKVKLGSETTEPIELTPEQYTEYQRYIGNKTDVLFTILSDSDAFLSLPDETKAKKLSGFLQDINMAAKIEVLGYRPKRVPKDVEEIIKFINEDRKATETYLDSEDFGAKDEE